jgi:uncharacterized protein (DUF1015 family)
VPRFSPFPAVRYARSDQAPVVSPPYDVLSDVQAEACRARDPHNITHLDVPTGPDRYARAGELYRRWLSEGVLVGDPAATLTVYRLRFTDATGARRDISGVVGGLEVVDEGAGGVLPHERTTPKASTDRLDLTRATAANLSPIWGLSLARGLTELLAEPGELLATVVDETAADQGLDGSVEHVIERITDPERIAAVSALVGSDDVLIADGHHRYGVARSYRDEIRAATGRTDTAAEDTLAFVNELEPDQLSVAAIHRLYDGVDVDDLVAALAKRFELSPAERPGPDTLARMQADGFLTLVTAGGSWRLSPRPGAFDRVRALDGLWLETTLADLQPAVTYQHGLPEVLAAVDSGRAVAGVLIRPVDFSEIERTAREGVLMPPKSTFFTPKLLTGFVLRPLD